MRVLKSLLPIFLFLFSVLGFGQTTTTLSDIVRSSAGTIIQNGTLTLNLVNCGFGEPQNPVLTITANPYGAVSRSFQENGTFGCSGIDYYSITLKDVYGNLVWVRPYRFTTVTSNLSSPLAVLPQTVALGQPTTGNITSEVTRAEAAEALISAAAASAQSTANAALPAAGALNAIIPGTVVAGSGSSQVVTFPGAVTAGSITDSALTHPGYVTNSGTGLLGSVATIPNAGLTNPSMTISGVTCTLGGNCTIGGTGVTQSIPSNTVFAFTGDSVNDDDSGVIMGSFPLTSYSCNGTVCTVVNTGTNGLSAGDWVNMRNATGFSAPPSYETLGTDYTLFKVLSTGLSSTQFEFSYTTASPTCSSSCGTAALANYNLPFNTTSQGALKGVGTTVMKLANPVSIAGLATNYSSLFHSISPAVSGNPGYLIIDGITNDFALYTCDSTSVATLEANLQSIWSQAHTDGWTVVMGSPNAVLYNEYEFRCLSFYPYLISIEKWLYSQGKDQSNASGGQYWDLFADVQKVVEDAHDTSLVASNGGLGPQGANMASAVLASVISSGISYFGSKSPEFFGLPQANVGGLANAAGRIIVPNVDSNYAFAVTDAAQDTILFQIDTVNMKVQIKSLLLSGVTGSTQCLQTDASGNVSGTGSACANGSTSTVSGVTVSGTPSTGQVLTATGSAAANWQTSSSSAGLTPLFGSANPLGTSTPSIVQSGSSASGSFTSSSSVTSGNLVVIVYRENAGVAPTALSDSLGTTFTLLTSTSAAYVYTGRASSSGIDTVTATGGNFQSLLFIEASNLSSTLDTSPTTGAGNPVTISTTTTVANDLVLSFWTDVYGMSCPSVSSGWTSVGCQRPGTYFTESIEYQIAPTATAYSITWTPGNSGTASIFSIKASSTPVSGTQGQLYFETGTSPYTEWVYNSNAWQEVQ
jgi:hypothetical protein